MLIFSLHTPTMHNQAHLNFQCLHTPTIIHTSTVHNQAHLNFSVYILLRCIIIATQSFLLSSNQYPAQKTKLLLLRRIGYDCASWNYFCVQPKPASPGSPRDEIHKPPHSIGQTTRISGSHAAYVILYLQVPPSTA